MVHNQMTRVLVHHQFGISSFTLIPLCDYAIILLSFTRSSLKKLFETEGIRGLFKGFSLNILKGPITLSLSLTTYDLLSAWVRADR
jgi:hypothetical protein